MAKGGIAGILILVVGVIILLAVLKIAIKLAFIGIVVVGAVVLFMAAKKLIGKE